MPESLHDAERAERRFVKGAMRAPLLEQAREQELARLWRDEHNQSALHELTTAYVRLVISMATRFRNYGLPMSDLVQEGNVGLMQAAARFEPERGVRFSTYAAWWIRSSIQDFVLRNWSIVRTGTTAAQKSLFFNFRRLRAQIDDLNEATLSPVVRDYVATKLGVDHSEVETMAARLYAGDRSLNAPISEGGEGEWQDILADESDCPEMLVMAEMDGAKRTRWIEAALQELSPRELLIIQERRLAEEGVTLESLGERLNISKERVRQIEHQALRRLRDALTRIVGDPVAAGLVN